MKTNQNPRFSPSSFSYKRDKNPVLVRERDFTFSLFAKLKNRILVLSGFVKNVDLNKYGRFKAENYSIIEENMIKCKVI